MPKLNDSKIARLARARDGLKKQIKDFSKDVTKADKAIIEELDSRGTKAIEHQGIRVNVVRSETPQHEVDAYEKALTPAKFKSITRPAIDPEKLAAAIQSGKISPDVVAACTTIKVGAPYIKTSYAEDE